jgi:hypothetical protein
MKSKKILLGSIRGRKRRGIKLNSYHVLFIDEVGDWKEPLYIIGGLIFNLCDFWEITTEIRKAKKEILVINPYEEFKWSKFTDVANGKIENISKENAKKYMEMSANIIKNKSEAFLAVVVELEKVKLWNIWKNSKQKKQKQKIKKVGKLDKGKMYGKFN